MERRIHATFEESRLATSDFGRSYLGNTAAYQTCTWNMYVTSESENKQISRHHPQPRWKHAERMAIWSQFCSLEKKYVIRLTYRSFASIMRIVNDEQRRFQTKVIRLTLTCRFILLRSDIAAVSYTHLTLPTIA